MLELLGDCLVFRFPELHTYASLRVNLFQTQRVEKEAPMWSPPVPSDILPLCRVDDYPNTVPPSWLPRGGVMTPMAESDAAGLKMFAPEVPGAGVSYPFAVKIGAGKVNILTRQPWTNELSRNPQDYIVVTKTQCIYGYQMEKAGARQFVAACLGQGKTPEISITGKERVGGIQVAVYPMKQDHFFTRFPHAIASSPGVIIKEPDTGFSSEMGFGAGWFVKQPVEPDMYGYDSWDQENFARCFIHLANSAIWDNIVK